jgi:hypothetical protein
VWANRTHPHTLHNLTVITTGFSHILRVLILACRVALWSLSVGSCMSTAGWPRGLLCGCDVRVGGDGKGGGAALPRSDREARVAELAGSYVTP